MHTDCALSGLRTAFLYMFDMKFRLRQQFSLCEIFYGKSGAGAGFSPSASDFPFIFILTLFPTHIHLATSLSRKTSGRILVTFKKQITRSTIHMQGFFYQWVKQLYHDYSHSLCTASRLRNRGRPLPFLHTSLCIVRDIPEPGELNDSSCLSSAPRHPQERCLF
jgi:hypothetical protein